MANVSRINPNIPGYSLTLSISDISNYQKIAEKIPLSHKALELLKQNGFAVYPTPDNLAEQEIRMQASRETAHPKDDFIAYYEGLSNMDVPIFITADSLLHYYHIFVNTTLMRLERDLFYRDIWDISQALLDASLIHYRQSQGDLKEAARRNIAYLSVALELLKPEKGQLLSEEKLKEEYCSAEMDPEKCERYLSGIKEQFGEKVSYQYFSANEFKQYTFEISEIAKALVGEEIKLIEKHEGWKFSPIFIYQEDYSQYIPRGHYTKSEKLKNYFQAMIWYGRMTALIKGSPILSAGDSSCSGDIGGIISDYDARIQTLQALLLAQTFAQSQPIQEKWNRIYAITSFMVGFSDDLGPYEYIETMEKVFAEEPDTLNISRFAEEYDALKAELSDLPYDPKIYSGLGACELLMPCPPLNEEEIENLKIQAKELLSETKGFRLMGQRFTPDSWLFSQIVSPYSGEYNGPQDPLPTEKKPFTFSWDDAYPEYRDNRPFTWVKTDVKACPPPAMREVRSFPRGLDIMAMLGSSRAKEILEESGDTQYTDYEEKFAELKKEFEKLMQEEDYSNLYLHWLAALKSLNQEYGPGYPTFMQTMAWQDKTLNTTLASWTELRHDTLLYVKQSYTMAEMGGIMETPVVGYVEPLPLFYQNLCNLTEMTLEGFRSLVPEQVLEELKIEAGLNRFGDILNRLLEISEKELENKPLDEQEYDFIENFGSISQELIESISGGDIDPDIFKTVLVADVHTEGNTEKVLEEGVGYLQTGLFAYRLPQEHIVLGVGPVFSYYEFKQPMAERLTDEAWRGILENNPPAKPEWTKTFSE
ncbi:MAG: DUF3160 domain-containing protein [Thermodesulfobacteriota bacterium]